MICGPGMLVTYLELLVASPCCLSLICFVLQAARDEGSREEKSKKRRTNLWDQPVHLQDDRTAARGNITMFPMPLCRDVPRHTAIDRVRHGLCKHGPYVPGPANPLFHRRLGF